jgi:acyl-coenzyme A synthetase/AMP-(fatty) acid ligase
MLKCSGFRVEPAEIERALQTLPGVVTCAVIGITDETAGQRPAAVVVLKAGTTIKQLRQALQQQLPAYMIPSRWKIIQVLPQLTNGKIDYIAIKNLFGSSA